MSDFETATMRAKNAVKKLKLLVFADDKRSILEYIAAMEAAGAEIQKNLAAAEGALHSTRTLLGQAKKRAENIDAIASDMPYGETRDDVKQEAFQAEQKVSMAEVAAEDASDSVNAASVVTSAAMVATDRIGDKVEG